MFAAAASVSIAGEFLTAKLKKKKGTKETLDERIERLTKSLTEATHLVGNIQNEIEERHKLVTKLQRDIDTYNKIASLKSDEVEAVAQVLRSELKSEGKKSFWQGVAINFVFFALGAILTLLTTA